MDHLKSVITGWISKLLQGKTRAQNSLAVELMETGLLRVEEQIEDYPAGYPQYSSLISSYHPFFICRSFRRLRGRLLLLKQDKLSVLEGQLDDIDRQEASPLFLGQSRCDRNSARAEIISRLEIELADYDAFLKRCKDVLAYNSAPLKDVKSLSNWVEGTGCLCSNETMYLHMEKDLISLASSSDLAMTQLENWVEEKLIKCYQGFREMTGFEVSRNPYVYIYSGSLVKRIATWLMLAMISCLLLAPVVIFILLGNMVAKVSILIFSVMCVLAALSSLTKARIIELVLAGATFATILVSFLSSSQQGCGSPPT